MRFKGQLLVPTEPGPGLRVDLEVAGHHLAVESEDGDLGAWPLEAVTVRRLEGDTFEMTVAGEDLHFVADDTISFAYSGMPAIERFSGPSPSRSRIRSFLGRLGSTSAPPRPAPAEPVPTPDQAQVKVEQPEPGADSVIGFDEPPPWIEPAQEEMVVEEPPSWNEPIQQKMVIDDPEDEIVDMDVLIVEEADPPSISSAPRPPQPSLTPSSSEEGNEPEPSCPGTTAEGLPCRSPILSSSGYCYSHDPERAVEDGYRKALDARARMKRKGTARLTKTYSRLEKAMRQVERGELEPEIAVAMAQIARTMCAILDLDDEEPEDNSAEELTPRF